MKNVTITKTFEAYEKLISTAWRTTKAHAELWPVAAMTSFLASGSILWSALRGIARIRPTTETSFAGVYDLFEHLPIIPVLIRNAAMLPAWHFLLILFSMIAIAGFTVWILLSAQQMLLHTMHRAVRRKKRLQLLTLAGEVNHKVNLRLLAVNAGAVILTSLLSSLAALPLSIFLDANADPMWNLLVFATVYGTILPLLFIVNTVQMFAFVNIAHFGDNIIEAFRRASRVTFERWLAALELAAVLLFINLFAVILFSVLEVIWIPFATIVVSAAAGMTSSVIMAAFGLIILLVAAGLYLLFIGGLVTFNYAAWTIFIERTERFGIKAATEAFARLIHRPFSR